MDASYLLHLRVTNEHLLQSVRCLIEVVQEYALVAATVQRSLTITSLSSLLFVYGAWQEHATIL